MTKKAIILLLVIALLSTTFAGCATKKEEVPYTEKSKEEIFTKTIHDFEGMYVENLDDQEDTNFLVYAEGVKEIAISPIINTLLDTDYENLTYTFTNANDTLRNLKRGDVLYAKATENSPDVVAAKVKKVDVQGEQVIVYSDEISLGDLFVYADVCMNVPMETEEVALTHAYPDEVLSTQTLPVGLEDRSVQLNKLATTTFTPNLPLKHSLNIQRGLGAKGDKGAVSVTGNLSYTLKTVTLEFRFSDEHMQLYSGVWYEYNVNNNVTLSVSGNAIDYSAPLRDIPLRVSFLKVTIKPKVKVKLSGSVSGSINHIEAARNGFTATVSLAGVERKPVNDTIFPAITTGKLTDLEGSFSIGLETREEIRLGFIGIVYGSVYAGLETTGAVELLKAETKEENLDSLHACTRCVDGDISAPIRISCGLDVKFDFRRSKGKISDALTGEIANHAVGIFGGNTGAAVD